MDNPGRRVPWRPVLWLGKSAKRTGQQSAWFLQASHERPGLRAAPCPRDVTGSFEPDDGTSNHWPRWDWKGNLGKEVCTKSRAAYSKGPPPKSLSAPRRWETRFVVSLDRASQDPWRRPRSQPGWPEDFITAATLHPAGSKSRAW